MTAQVFCELGLLGVDEVDDEVDELVDERVDEPAPDDPLGELVDGLDVEPSFLLDPLSLVFTADVELSLDEPLSLDDLLSLEVLGSPEDFVPARAELFSLRLSLR